MGNKRSAARMALESLSREIATLQASLQSLRDEPMDEKLDKARSHASVAFEPCNALFLILAFLPMLSSRSRSSA